MEDKTRKKGEGNGATSVTLNSSEIPNDLKKLINNLDPEDFCGDTLVKVRDLLKELDKFWTTSIETKLTYGKKLRNKITVEYLDTLISIIKDL
ncbi:hypothetical protein AVEN_61107-1 [Araneus ventricosus]|uniref:Uncharacterized protein n=1 Tax=Araneus ventricosus TaxID=182803 RepID=A0A4Y2BJQ7_ARAVE|nr:hypothetical protein AVEN_61107-1 [Araneus ventricosus]